MFIAARVAYNIKTWKQPKCSPTDEQIKKMWYVCVCVCVWWNTAVLYLVAESCLTLCDPMDCSPPGSSVHVDSPGKNTGVGCHSFLQGLFPTQGSNPGLPLCRWILYYWATREAWYRCGHILGSPRLIQSFKICHPDFELVLCSFWCSY